MNCIGIPIIKIRQSHDGCIFIIGYPHTWEDGNIEMGSRAHLNIKIVFPGTLVQQVQFIDALHQN